MRKEYICKECGCEKTEESNGTGHIPLEKHIEALIAYEKESEE